MASSPSTCTWLLTREPLKEGQDPLAAFYGIIENTITNYPILQLSNLHILEIAAKHVQKIASTSSNGLERQSGLLVIRFPVNHFHLS
jgi:hypothetical protein